MKTPLIAREGFESVIKQEKILEIKIGDLSLAGAGAVVPGAGLNV